MRRDLQLRSAGTVPILLYHSVAADGDASGDPWQVTADDFHRDMKEVVATGRMPMTARSYAAWLRAGADPGTRPVLVTFDDGFADYAEIALPILRQHEICSTLFVTSGFIGRDGMLSADAIAELASEDDIEIGAHSVTHPHLDTVSRARARAEVVASRRALEDIVGGWVTSFAYPHGSFDNRTRRLVVDGGYTTAHAVKNALSHPADDVFGLGRFTVTARTSRDQVRATLAGTGAPVAWSRERLRTTGYRVVRRVRTVGGRG